MPLDRLQALAAGDSVCHRWPVGFKLALVALTIAAVLLVPPGTWPAYGLAACWVVAGLILAEVPANYWLARARLLLPGLAGLALSIPLSRGFVGGWEQAATVVVRGTIAFLSALWLAGTTPVEQILTQLRRWGCPGILVDQLAFTVRYVGVILEELSTLRTAQESRTMSPPGWSGGWLSGARLLGQLVIRSLSRAERVHQAMLARGWTGRMPE